MARSKISTKKIVPIAKNKANLTSTNEVKKIKINLASMPDVEIYSDMPIKRKTSSFHAVVALCLLTLGLLVGISITCIVIFFAS